MGGYLAYPEYKESGVDWLGEIPAHWGVFKVRHVISKITNGYVTFNQADFCLNR